MEFRFLFNVFAGIIYAQQNVNKVCALIYTGQKSGPIVIFLDEEN
jgi:hypothetical protein